jgi:Thiamine pyrophosphate enzyme, N-terminal TPP binding domain
MASDASLDQSFHRVLRTFKQKVMAPCTPLDAPSKCVIDAQTGGDGNLARQPYMAGRNFRIHEPLNNSDRVMRRTFWIGGYFLGLMSGSCRLSWRKLSSSVTRGQDNLRVKVHGDMTGAEYIAKFLASVGCERVFVLTGGACAFMIDAVARHPALTYSCFNHEQSAAMAADAVWRVSRKVGVTMATSGPGATNLITGIACSYFDSSLHPHYGSSQSTGEQRLPRCRCATVRFSGDQNC